MDCRIDGIKEGLARYVLPIVMVVFFASCQDLDDPCQKPGDNFISEMRDLKDFNGISVSAKVVADINITQANDFSVQIYGPENVVELTRANVEGDALVINSDGCFIGESKLVIDISAPDYETISIAGEGKLKTVGDIQVDVLQLDFLGVGGVEADIYADTLYTTMAGAGVLNYAGKVGRHIAITSGIYTMNSYPLVTDYTYIYLTGVGDSFVTVNEFLKVIVEGQGKVFYKGNPTIQSEILGDGEIVDKN